MRGRRKTALGIDIGPSRVTVALVERKDGECSMLRYASCAVSDPAGETRDAPRALVHTLRRLRRQVGTPRVSAAMGISISPLVLQMLDMPKQMPQNVREFVEGELGQYVTLSGKAIVCDFCVAGSGRDSQRRLLSAAGEKETIRGLVEACGAAGLSVETVEPSILAYARARCGRRRIGARPSTVLVVEMVDCQLSACLLRRGRLDFVRTKGLPAEVAGAEAANQWLGDEVVTMMRHCSLESSEGDVGWEVDIILREGTPATREVAEPLHAATGVLPRIITESEKSEHAGVDAGDPGPESADVGAFATAAGLAMRLLDGQMDPWRVDLLPDDVTQARGFTRHMLITATAAAVVFLGMILSLLLVSRLANGMRRDLDRRRAVEKLYLTPALAEETHMIDRQLAWAQRQVQEITKALNEANRVEWARVVSTAFESVPAGACVTRLSSQDAEHVTISGAATTGRAVRNLARALGHNDLFESVALQRLDRQQDNASLIQYQMDCLLKSLR
jgi:Tfp pilus assembly protein PilN